jgi:hypothetical protein
MLVEAVALLDAALEAVSLNGTSDFERLLTVFRFQ